MKKWGLALIFVAGVAVVIVAAAVFKNAPASGFNSIFGGKF